MFIGFLPQQPKARRATLATYASLPAALVFYEAPHRIADTCRVVRGARRPPDTDDRARAHENFETIASMPLADAPAWVAADVNRSRGEFVLIVGAAPADARAHPPPADVHALLDALVAELAPSRAARVAAKITGLPRDVLYAQALAMKPESPAES